MGCGVRVIRRQPMVIVLRRSGVCFVQVLIPIFHQTLGWHWVFYIFIIMVSLNGAIAIKWFLAGLLNLKHKRNTSSSSAFSLFGVGASSFQSPRSCSYFFIPDLLNPLYSHHPSKSILIIRILNNQPSRRNARSIKPAECGACM